MVDHIRNIEDDMTAVVHIYCRSYYEECNSALQLWSSIIRQLLEQCRPRHYELHPAVKAIIAKDGEKNEQDLLDIIINGACSLFDRIFVFVDALVK